MSPAITASDLTKVYDDLVAVDGVDLEIDEGEIFGLLGPNGAGKTTTIQMLATLEDPTSGTGTVAGKDIRTDAHGVRQRIGIVFQQSTVDDVLTAEENLRMHGMMYGVPSSEMDGRIAELLDLVELTDRADDQVDEFSGGMKRRLELVRGIMHEPQVLFLDEPTLGLDPQTREHIWDYIEAMVEELRTTVVLTTHYMDEADRLCDRVGVIDDGEIVALDTPDALKARLGGDVVKLTGVPVKAIDGAPGVLDVEAIEDGVLLTVEEATKDLAGILRHVEGVESVEVHSPTLNDVFLSITGRELRDGGDRREQEVGHRG